MTAPPPTRSELPSSPYDATAFAQQLPPRLTFDEAAKIRRCHVSHLYVLAGRGRFRVVKDGRKSYIDTKSFIDDWMNLPEASIQPPVERQRA
jgi:hypothetical protein